jgi:hypothetical protein
MNERQFIANRDLLEIEHLDRGVHLMCAGICVVIALLICTPLPVLSASLEQPCPGHMIAEVVRLEAQRFKAEDAHRTREAADIQMREGRIDEACSVQRAAQDYSSAETDYELIRDFVSAKRAAQKAKMMYHRMLDSRADMKNWEEARAGITEMDAALKRLLR